MDFELDVGGYESVRNCFIFIVYLWMLEVYCWDCWFVDIIVFDLVVFYVCCVIYVLDCVFCWCCGVVFIWLII